MNGSPAVAAKNIDYILRDGIPNGRIECKFGSWIGRAYRIPRLIIADRKNLDEIKRGGIYLLLNNRRSDEPFVYIGQASDILNRLRQHHKSPNQGQEEWVEAIAFTAIDDTWMSATEIDWLENHFYRLAKDAGSYEVKNGNEPSTAPVDEAKKSVLEEYADIACVLTGVLGHPVFEPPFDAQAISTENNDEASSGDIVFKLKQGGLVASGQRTNAGFALFRGSGVSATAAAHCPKNAIRQRELHAAKIGPDGILTETILLKSPNEAACFATGTAMNARLAWRTPDGRTLNDVETSEAG